MLRLNVVFPFGMPCVLFTRHDVMALVAFFMVVCSWYGVLREAVTLYAGVAASQVMLIQSMAR